MLRLPVPRRLPAAWPTNGAIDVQSLVVRYRDDLEPVLDGINFSVQGAAFTGSPTPPLCCRNSLWPEMTQ